MAQTRPAWTDERLDDLNGQVGDLGRRMDAGFARVDEGMDAGFARVDADIRALRQETHTDIRELREDFNALNRTLLRVGGGAIVTLVVGFASVLVV